MRACKFVVNRASDYVEVNVEWWSLAFWKADYSAGAFVCFSCRWRVGVRPAEE